MPGMNLKQSFKACMDGALPRVVEFLMDRVALPFVLILVSFAMVVVTIFVMTLVVVIAPFAPFRADVMFHKFLQGVGK